MAAGRGHQGWWTPVWDITGDGTLEWDPRDGRIPSPHSWGPQEWNPRDPRSPMWDPSHALHHTPPLPPSPCTFFNPHFQTAQDEAGGGKGGSGAWGFIPARLFPACQMGRRKLSIILYLEVGQNHLLLVIAAPGWGLANIGVGTLPQKWGHNQEPSSIPSLPSHPPSPCPVSHLPEPDK